MHRIIFVTYIMPYVEGTNEKTIIDIGLQPVHRTLDVCKKNQNPRKGMDRWFSQHPSQSGIGLVD